MSSPSHCVPNSYGRPWPVVYIAFVQITHQIQVLTEPLCLAWGIFNLLPNNEWRTKQHRLILKCFFLQSAMADRLYNVHAKHTSKSGFDRTFMPCSSYFYLLSNNEWGTKYRGFTYSAK